MNFLASVVLLVTAPFASSGETKGSKSMSGMMMKKDGKGSKSSGKGGIIRDESFICVALMDLYGDGRTGNPPAFEDPILTAQPNCRATCDTKSDARFVDIIGLQNGTEPNIDALDDVIDKVQLHSLVSTFSNMYVMPEKVRACIMNPELHLDDGLFDASSNLNVSILQFSPPRTDLCSRQLGSMGLFYDTNKSEVQSICNPDSPGRQWNTFLLNGQFDELYEQCGYVSVTGDGYYADLMSEPGCSAALTAFPCQQNISQSGGNHAQCYCMFEEALGLHCPMFGPIYYVNAKAVWNLGGLDYLGRMPGRRVFCFTDETASDCSNTCGQATIDDFDRCTEFQ